MTAVIFGTVAGGATAAARIRRLDEHTQITIFERAGYVSYAFHADTNAAALKDQDLAYAPPYASAKDPVNITTTIFTFRPQSC